MTNDPNFAVPCPAGTCENLTSVIDREYEDFVSVHCKHCNITVRHDHRWYFNRRTKRKEAQADEARRRFSVFW